MPGLVGKRVLIAGASSGIGVLCADQLAAEGAELALVARSQAGLEKAARRARRHGVSAHVLPADVTDRDALAGAVDAAAERMGGIDLVVSAAAAAAYGEFRETPPEDFDRTIEVTFIGAANLIRETLPHLERSRGNLIVVGSATDRVPLPLLSAYSASKAALSSFIEVLRAELRAAGSPVRVSLLRPGPVDTPFWTHVTNPDGLAPPSPTLAYSPDSVAHAVVAMAKRPRPTFTIGGAMAAVQLASRVGPAGRAGLAVGARLAMRASRHPPGVIKALWEPSGEGNPEQSGRSRPSLWVELGLRRLPF